VCVRERKERCQGLNAVQTHQSLAQLQEMELWRNWVLLTAISLPLLTLTSPFLCSPIFSVFHLSPFFSAIHFLNHYNSLFQTHILCSQIIVISEVNKFIVIKQSCSFWMTFYKICVSMNLLDELCLLYIYMRTISCPTESYNGGLYILNSSCWMYTESFLRHCLYPKSILTWHAPGFLLQDIKRHF